MHRLLGSTVAFALALAFGGCGSSKSDRDLLQNETGQVTSSAASSPAGPRDEADPMTHVGDLEDAARRPVAIKRLVQFYEDAMTKDGKARGGPHVKPLVDRIVEPLNRACLDAALEPPVRSTLVRVLAEMQDPRAEGCMRKVLDEFAPGEGEDDVRNVMRAVAVMKQKSLAPEVMKAFTRIRFSKPKAKLIGKDVTAAVLAVAGPAQEDEFLKLLDAPIDLNVEENVHDQAFWQSVAVRALGDMQSAKAVRPFMKIILSPSKGAVANTALVGLVKIGKAAVGPAEALLKGEDKELADHATTALLVEVPRDKDGKIPEAAKKSAEKAHVSTAAQILGALGSESSIGPLLGELAKLETARDAEAAETRVIIALVLPLLPRSKVTVAAFQHTFELSKIDLEVPGVGRAQELLADSACDLFDASVAPWIVKAATSLKGAPEDVDPVRQYAFMAAMKTMRFEDVGAVGALSRLPARGVDSNGGPSGTTVGAEYGREWVQAKALVEHCKAEVDCYLAKLTDDESQKKAGQFTGIKAAYMVGILGDDSTRSRILDAIPKITNGAVRQAALKALQALAPKGDEAAARKLLGYLLEAEVAKDEERIRQYGVFTQVAASLRARAVK